VTSPPAGLPPLRDAFISSDQKRLFVRRLFATIADRYDLITVVLSYGQDQRWKRGLVGLVDVRADTHALDLACGTGDIAFQLAERGARTVGLDVTIRMLQLARRRQRSVSFVTGDMMALPFPDGAFDVVTTGYGLRNVPAIEAALGEVRRVLRPEGTLLSLDFNRPSNAAVRAVYLGYLTVVGSLLGLVLHRSADTYRYIPESIRRYPGAEGVCRLAVAQGFSSCEWLPVLGGLMAIHRAIK
jgi:demethylmenaquinone methyltransferase/2-methoxy-6-polyprenyl-1,4-benzoquinol methylase